MMLLLVLALSWFRETNSHAASARGTRSYQKQQYGEAVKSLRRALELVPSPQNAFNLGTAQIAAGEREQGAATLEGATQDPALRADALFNRGNGALAAKSFDRAIADYTEALRARPSHAGAKRNLEIALLRREASRTGSSGRQQNKPGNDEQQRKPAPTTGGQEKKGQPDLEALLRSVQQQEQEELRRMKAKAAKEGRVGW